MFTIRLDLAPANAEHAMALRSKRIECCLGGLAGKLVNGLRGPAFFEARREAQNVFGSALYDEEPLAFALEENRHATPFESERDLINFAPGGEVTWPGGENCLIERAL